MSILVNVTVPDGIVMACDSRVTHYVGGVKKSYEDNACKYYYLQSWKVVITYCGNASIGERSIASFLNDLEIEDLNKTDIVIDISNKLLAKIQKENVTKTIFYIGGYIGTEQYLYKIEELNLRRRNFGGPGHTLFYRYDCDGQSQYMNTNLKNGKNSPDFSKMSLKEAKGFAYNMIVYTYMEEQRQNENYCGGDVEIFSIQRDEIAHTKESVTWMSNQS